MTELTSEHLMSTFAFHVRALCNAKPGDKFGLSFWQSDKAHVEVSASPGGTPLFTMNGEMVGNSCGAYQWYAKHVAHTVQLVQ